MTITAKVIGTDITYTLETEADLRSFLAGMKLEKWSVCEICGKGFRGSVYNQKYCPAIPPDKKSRCGNRAAYRRKIK